MYTYTYMYISLIYFSVYFQVWGFPDGSAGKESVCSAGDTREASLIPRSERSLKNEMLTHSSILSWKILWTEDPGRLKSKGLQRVGHDWVTKHTSTHIQVWDLKLIMGAFCMAWGLWSFCGFVSQDMNPWNSLWVFCEDVRYTISLKLFFLECEVSSLIVGVCCGTWALYYVCECMSWVAKSLSSVWVHLSYEVSVLFSPFYHRICFWFFVCVCQGCEMSSIFGYMFQFVRSLPCLWVDDVHRTWASLLFWMYGQGLEISDLFGIIWHGMWSLWATYWYVSQDGVF